MREECWNNALVANHADSTGLHPNRWGIPNFHCSLELFWSICILFLLPPFFIDFKNPTSIQPDVQLTAPSLYIISHVHKFLEQCQLGLKLFPDIGPIIRHHPSYLFHYPPVQACEGSVEYSLSYLVIQVTFHLFQLFTWWSSSHGCSQNDTWQ